MELVLERYNISGVELGKDDKSVVVMERKGRTCKIRIGPHNKLFHPRVDDESELKAVNKRTGELVFRFHKCSVQCFESYLDFLKTGSITYLHAAEREI